MITTKEWAIHDLATRVRILGRKVGLTSDETMAAIREEMTIDLSDAGLGLAGGTSADRAMLRRHGMDAEQFRALNKKDGGVAYRALMQKRSATKEAV